MVKRVKISIVNNTVLIITQDPQQLHILALIQELMKESIPYRIQSNTKSIQFDFPNPNGRKFVVADNRQGPLVLGTDFTISNVLVIGYPNSGTNNSNNYYSRPKQIIERYHQFIDLGQYEVKSFRTTSALRTDQTLSRTKKGIRLKSIQKIEKISSQKVWDQKIPILICFSTGKQSQKFQELLQKIKNKNKDILICRRSVHLSSFIRPSQRKEYYILCTLENSEDVLANCQENINLILFINFGANLQMGTCSKVAMMSSSIKEILAYLDTKSFLYKDKVSKQSFRDEKPLCSIVFRTESRQNTHQKKTSENSSSQANQYFFEEKVKEKLPSVNRKQGLKFTFINQPKTLSVKNTILQQKSNTSALKSSVDFSHQSLDQKQISQIRSSFSQNNIDRPKNFVQSDKIMQQKQQEKKNTNSTQFCKQQFTKCKNLNEQTNKNLQQNSEAETVKKMIPPNQYYSEAKQQTKLYQSVKQEANSCRGEDSIIKKSILKASQKFPIKSRKREYGNEKQQIFKQEKFAKTARKKSLSNNLQPITHIKRSNSQDNKSKSQIKRRYWKNLRNNDLPNSPVANKFLSKSNFFRSISHRNQNFDEQKKSKYHQFPTKEYKQSNNRNLSKGCLFLFDRTNFQMYSLCIRKNIKQNDKILTHQTSSQLYEQIQLYDKFELVIVLSNVTIRKSFPEIMSMNNIYQVYILDNPICMVSRNKIQITDIRQLKDSIKSILDRNHNETQKTSSTQAQFPFTTILYKSNNSSIKQIVQILSSKLFHMQMKQFCSLSDLVLLIEAQKDKRNRYLILADDKNYQEYMLVLNKQQERCFYVLNNKNSMKNKKNKLTVSEYQDPYKQIIYLMERTKKYKTV